MPLWINEKPKHSSIISKQGPEKPLQASGFGKRIAWDACNVLSQIPSLQALTTLEFNVFFVHAEWMGRQLHIALSEDDDRDFLNFLKSKGGVSLIKTFATTQDKLWIELEQNIPEERSLTYYIWNKKFSWTPEYAQTKTPEKHCYIKNISNAPVIEYSRNPSISDDCGRLYWAKDFATDNLDYDVDDFTKWYNMIAQWVKKHAAGKQNDNGVTIWFLPDAWQRYKQN